MSKEAAESGAPRPSNAEEGENGGITGHSRRAPVSFFKQLGALQLKNLRQKKRSPVGCCVELFLPVVFVLGLVVMWAVSDQETKPPQHFLSPDGTPLRNLTDYALDHLCRNVSIPNDPDTEALIPACPIGVALQCAHDGLLPLDGLCARNLDNISTFISYAAWHRNDEGLEVLTLDQAALVRWLGRTIYGEYHTDASSYLQPDNALTLGSYLYIANDNATLVAQMETYLNRTYPLFKYLYGRSFPTESEAIDFMVTPGNHGKVWALIVPLQVDHDNFDVTIRGNRTNLPWSGTPNREYFSAGLGSAMHRNYFTFGFFTLQLALQDFYVRGYHGKSNISSDIPAAARGLFPLTDHSSFAVMPLAPYRQSGFLTLAGAFSPIILTLAYLYSVSQLVKRLVEEKEKKLKEGMLIMGLHKAGFYSSWVLTYSLQQLISSLIISIVLKLTILEQTEWTLIFLLFFLFSLSTITFATFLSTWFSSARTSAVVSPLVFFATAMPSLLSNPSNPNRALLIGAGFLPPNIFGAGSLLAFRYEATRGMGWQDAWSGFDTVKLGEVLIWLSADIVGYLVLTVYLDAVLPSEWGTNLHPCFCFLGLCKKKSDDATTDQLTEQELKTPHLIACNPLREDISSGFGQTSEPSVRIRNMTKTFEADGTIKIAVDKMNLDIYPDEITVILGHNGAGKTTAISMLTGMLPISSGSCQVYNKSVATDLAAVRQDIGYCPQHNILWDDLTVREHLEFYQAIKGGGGESVDDIIRDTDLGAFENVLAGALSGGNKRKLSIANCFVGGSRLIMLDEPTAGMDVVARRHTWDLIKRMAPGRTILLTTHYMDEADLLGSQLAVMSHGNIVCSGSSMFLKSKLGVGYSLNLALEGGSAQNDSIIAMVRSHVASVETVSAKGGELVLRLPTHAVDSFPDMLTDLEVRGHELGVRSFGLSITTLEEVFLKIADGLPTTKSVLPDNHPDSTYSEAEPVQTVDDCGNVTSAAAVTVPSPNTKSDTDSDDATQLWPEGMKHECRHSIRQQFVSLLKKRLHVAKRDRRALCLQIIFPAVIICLAIFLGAATVGGTDFLNLDGLHLKPDGFPVIDVDVAASCGDMFLTTGFHLSGSPTASQVPTVYNFSEHLLKTHDIHAHYVRDQAIYCNPDKTQVTVFTNSTGHHASAVGFAVLANGLTNQFLGRTAANPVTVHFSTYNLPWTDDEAAWINSFLAIFVGLFILIPFTFIPSNFISQVVKEKETKAKHLQLVSGVHYAAYWASFFVFDIIMFLCTEVIVLVLFVAFDRKEYIGDSEVFGATVLVFLFFGLSGISYSYLCSFAFENHGTAQNIMLLVNFVCGFLLVILVFVLSLTESTKDMVAALKFIFRVSPPFCLGESVVNLAAITWDRSQGIERHAFDLDVTGWPLIYLAVELPLYLGMTMLLDHPGRELKRQQLFHDPDTIPAEIDDEDADVTAERTAVESGSRPGDLVSMRHLCKKYPSGKEAVRNMSFGVQPSEVFAFLGTNGAGKTTTMSILTGEQLPTHGHGFVAGHDVVSDAAEARKKIGYCPQFDALIDLLTPKEHLDLYAALRGVPSGQVDDVVSHLLKICCLSDYASVPSHQLSGGNKRKLSVALSLIGSPKVLFLDEPSAGMDPASRRQLWGVIRRAAQDCSVVLTTHHLEEVEVLADRVAIMTGGALRCIGSLQHLKGKFGSGFEMIIKVEQPALHMADMIAALTKEIPNAALGEVKQQRATFNLPREGTSLSQVFRVLRDHKEQLHIADYSFAQTSLEMVFIRISEESHDTTPADKQLLDAPE